MAGYDFRGWATRNDRRCSDGRVIKRNAFADCDGKKVPLVYNHNHDDINAILGYGVLHNANGGVIVDGYFNDTDEGIKAKKLMKHGDIESLSIHATNLKQNGSDVVHGIIREVSLVLAGANPGALVIDHSADEEENGYYSEEKATIYSGELLHSADDEDYDEELDEEVEEDEDLEHDDVEDDEIDEDDEDFEDDEYEDDEDYEEDDEMEHSFDELIHSYDQKTQDVLATMDETQLSVAFGLVALAQADEDGELSHALSDVEVDDEEIQNVLDTMDDEQLATTYALVGAVSGDDDDEDEDENYEEDDEMEHNVFDRQERKDENFVITTEDQASILQHAMESSCGSFKKAMQEFFDEKAAEFGEDAKELMHGFSDDDMEYLFPDFKDPAGDGEPWTLTRDMGWVDKVINGTHKTPFSRIKTRYIDATGTGIRARGYKKGDEKKEIADVEVLHRETTPQTIYVKDSLDRDDLVDFTEFGIVAYQNKIMTMAIKEEAAIAIMFGDGRSKNDPDKIKEDHIRPIWTDDEVYTIHQDIDLDATRTELQGTETGKHFGQNYIWAESFVNASLYSREKYKGSGNLTCYMTPHTRNVMLLARDYNGRRIYSTVSELAAALDVKEIVTVEQMEGLVRDVKETVEGQEVTKKKKPLAIFVNLADYNVGATKGGEITSFEQFDIDFNKEKYLKEARFSGALTRIKSAIVLEEDVTESF